MYTSVNHNMMAANTARNLNTHYSRLATSTQRLSSGLRINSAADDAAGLAIRELQRADVAALHQGARNANDAISMIQVADGALGIIDEKLIRIKELAEQAATGTYDSTQRLMIDSEFQAMASEIDRIAIATDFNGIHLLDGSLSGKHNGSGLNSTGAMKIHFGSGNESAEDYYYVEIGDCTIKGLGLGNQELVTDKITIYEEVTWTEDEYKTFVPKKAYTIFKDPENGDKVYYYDGEIYFSDVSDPVGTALDIDNDKGIINRLQSEHIYSRSRTQYQAWIHKDTGETFYMIDGSGRVPSWVRDPDDTEIVVPPPNVADLIPTNQWVIRDRNYYWYKDETGNDFYSYDGIHFGDYFTIPNKIVLDSSNPDHQQAVAKLKPVLQEETFYPYEVVHVTPYVDSQNADKYYYSTDNGNTFYTNSNDPEGSKLDPVTDKNLIDRLVLFRPQKIEASASKIFDEYRTPGGGRFFTNNGGKTFCTLFGYPEVALDASNPADTAIINTLTPVPSRRYTPVQCLAYRDGSDNIYYTYNNGKSYFTSLTDPENTRITPVGSLSPSPLDNATLAVVYNECKDPITNLIYYKNDKSDEFVRDPADPSSILDKNNPTDNAILNRLELIPDQRALGAYHKAYNDPETGAIYYSFSENSTDKFVIDVNNLDNIALNNKNAADRVIINRLVPVYLESSYNDTIRREYPNEYQIFKDQGTDKIYYNFDGKWTTDAEQPYMNLIDENDPLLDNLQPIAIQVTHTGTIEHTIDGETHFAEGYYSISTQEAAQQALAAIDNAIVSKDKIRAHLGALQNRLENTVTNLNIQAENLQTAESRISDVDVATEMTNFVRNQILTQSATAMLSQANNMPQMMMQLIGG